MIDVLVSSLELSLQILVALEGLPHLVIHEEFIRDFKRNQELGCVRSSLQLWEPGEDPVQDMLDGSLLTVDDFPLEVWVEVTWVAKHLEVSNDSLLGLVLCFSLDVNISMARIETAEELVEQLQKFKWSFVIELNETEVAHERWTVEAVYDLLDVCGGQSGGFAEGFAWRLAAKETCAILSVILVHFDFQIYFYVFELS